MPFFGTLLKILLGITAFMNYQNRQRAAGEYEQAFQERMIPEEQVRASTIQDFARRGLLIGAQSPAIQEALRRSSLPYRQQQARIRYEQAMSGPDPFSILFGLFGME